MLINLDRQLKKISHYPCFIKERIENLYRDPFNLPFAENENATFIHPKDIEKTKKEALSESKINWIYSFFQPCIFAATVSRRKDGLIEEANAGHFPTRFLPNDLKALFPNKELNLIETTFWVSGSAKRSSDKTLREAAEKIRLAVEKYSHTLRLDWEEAEKRPWLIDARTGWKVSDLGLGTINQNGSNQEIGRIAYLGVTTRYAFLFSLASNRHNGSTIYHSAHLFTEDVEVEPLIYKE